MVGFCKVVVISENKTHKEIGYYEFLYGSMLLVFSNILMEVLNELFLQNTINLVCIFYQF